MPKKKERIRIIQISRDERVYHFSKHQMKTELDKIVIGNLQLELEIQQRNV